MNRPLIISFVCLSLQEDANRGKPNWEHLSDELHVLITVEDTENRAQMKLERAVEEVKKLLVPVSTNTARIQISRVFFSCYAGPAIVPTVHLRSGTLPGSDTRHFEFKNGKSEKCSLLFRSVVLSSPMEAFVFVIYTKVTLVNMGVLTWNSSTRARIHK